MSLLKRFFLNVLAILLGLAIIPIILEIGLRFFPVFSGMPVNRTGEVYSFTPNVTIQRSSNWDMSNARKRQVNNVGFISDQAYDSAAKTPLIAIVGDSYIEAMQVDYRDTVEANLLAKCAPNARVYSFGAQFAPLSQYLSWVKYASQTYQPQIMVVNIVGNDFDESLLSHQIETNAGGVPGMQFYDFSHESPRLVAVPFKQEGWLTQALRHSALAQYLVRNVGVVNLVNDYRNGINPWAGWGNQSKQNSNTSNKAAAELTSQDSQVVGVNKGADSTQASKIEKGISAASSNPSEYVGNAKRAYSPQKLQLAKKAVDTFLSQLPEAAHLPSGAIVLTVDAERPLIYTSAGQQDLTSFFSVMREYFMQRARSQGFIVVDLRPAMIKQFKISGEQFEFSDDNHWNANGHRLMAKELYRVPAIQNLCQNSSR
jgi:hypothetical protein